MIPIAKPLLGEEEKQAVCEVIDSGMIASGPKTVEFEQQFAQFVQAQYAVATTSGTTALHLALHALGISAGDEVILPSFSFIATANAVLFCGGTPVFCDVDPKTFTLDPQKIESLITEKTKGIMPVHLYGQPADMDPILKSAADHDLFVVGDAAQAHGAEYHGIPVGSFGDCECFSFYPTKNMTTGEGGMVTTNKKELFERLQSLRNHGRMKTNWGYEHGFLGYNYRMTDLSAAIGLVQLQKLPAYNKKRRENAQYLNEQLHEKQVETPFVLPDVKHVYHQYTIKCQDREQVIAQLKAKEVGFGIYYPKPLHQYSHLQTYGHENLTVSEELSQQVLSLPVHPLLSQQDLETIVSCF